MPITRDKCEKQIRLDEMQFQGLMQKLDIIVHLQTVALLKDKNLRESIKILGGAGLGPSKIANLLGKKAGYVRKELAVMRKKGGYNG